MRKTLLGFMTLLMLTPALACMMAFCPMQTAQAAIQKPCHDMPHMTSMDNMAIKKETPKTPMLALDCMGVDFFSQVTVIDYSIDQPVIIVSYPSWIDLTAHYDVQADARDIIRGPPDWPQISQTQPPVFLTTQRFRV